MHTTVRLEGSNCEPHNRFDCKFKYPASAGLHGKLNNRNHLESSHGAVGWRRQLGFTATATAVEAPSNES
jgi:hypothetical protein